MFRGLCPCQWLESHPFTVALDSEEGVCCRHSYSFLMYWKNSHNRVDEGVIVGSPGIYRYFLRTIWYCLHPLSDQAGITITEKTEVLQHVSPENQASVRCK